MSSDGETRRLTGLATARGFACGPVFVYRGDGELPIPEYLIAAGCESDELLRLRRAYFETRRDLEGMIRTLRERTGRAEVKVFECHLMILEDQSLCRETEGYVVKERLNAEMAVRRTVNNARALFARMNDPYFRERVRDLDDIERRLQKNLMGFAANPHVGLKVPSIVVADDLTPSETVQLPRDLVLGFATNGGSTTSHVALLARAMGIPAVTGLVEVTALVTPGETVLLDGTAGTVTIRPKAAEIRDFRDLIERQNEIREEAVTGAPAGTLRGGGEVLLCANFHPGAPLDAVRDSGARGIGLYRSEYLWLNGEGEPSEEDQFKAYREVAEAVRSLAPGASATIRVLDIGGDKMVRGISQRQDTRQAEANPFLGNRSIRYLLSNQAVFETQLRAILQASACGRLALLYPMVSCVDELRAAAKVLEKVRSDLDAEGVPYDREIKIGAMVEIPSAALNADAFAKYVDFFSIGTNDLVQYTMAADRGNEAVSNLYQPTNPAVVRLVRMTIDAAKRHGVRVAVCGESAGDPLIGALWAAMGADELSMSPTYIPVVSKLLMKLTRADLDEYAKTVGAIDGDTTADEILAKCRAWMLDKVPDLDNIII